MTTNMFRSNTARTVEAHQYDGTPESASTIAQALGLNMVQQSPRAAVYTVPDRLQFAPGDYYDAQNREIAILTGAWIWVNHERAVLGCEWNGYFVDHYTRVDDQRSAGNCKSAKGIDPGAEA